MWKLLKWETWTCVYRLRQSGVTEDGCVSLASALTSNPIRLRELNLGSNKLTDGGIKRLCDVLNADIFQLEWELRCTALNRVNSKANIVLLTCSFFLIRLNECCLTESCCSSLASVLLKESSSLKVLNLGGNHLQDAGVEALCVGLESPNCKLEILR